MIIRSGNNYLIQAKRNQQLLYKQIQINTMDDAKCIDSHQEVTRSRGRLETRNVFVYKDITDISDQWTALARLIRVERYVSAKNGHRHQRAYYISNVVSDDASFFAKHIRNHWAIENRLHWVKDVIAKEDISKTAKGMAAENISIIRNISINLYRSNGYDSIKYAIELYANNFKELIGLVNTKPPAKRIT